MTSLERKEARYQRRKLKRQKRAITFDELITIDNLVHAHFQTRKHVLWKASTVRFDKFFLKRCTIMYLQLQKGTWRPLGCNVFFLNQRGKLREIHSLHYEERVLRRVICKQLLYPLLEPKLIYDNGASRKYKGLAHSVKRLKLFLHELYRVDNSNEGYVLHIDIHNFFASIQSIKVYEQIEVLIKDDRLKTLLKWLITSNEFIQLGPEDSQILALYYTNSVDHLIQDVHQCRWYVKYMDDSCLLSKNKEVLQELLVIIRQAYLQLGLTLNEKKTYITKVSHGFTFCKTNYYLTETGKVILKPVHNGVKRTRDKLRALKRLVDKGEIDATAAKMSYMSMRSTYAYRNSWRTVRNLDIMFFNLFQLPIKKGVITMRRGTTATHIFRASEDLSRATVIVTYMQGGLTILEKTNADLTISGRKVTLHLTQEDTLSFKAGLSVSVQMRYVNENGHAEASNVVTINVADVLRDGEISYEPVPDAPVQPEPAVGIIMDGNIADWAHIRRLVRNSGIFNQIAVFRATDHLYLMYELNDATKAATDQVMFRVNDQMQGGYKNRGIKFLLQNGILNEYAGNGDDWKWVPTQAKVTKVSNENYMAEFKIELSPFGAQMKTLSMRVDIIDDKWAILEGYPMAEGAMFKIPSFKEVYSSDPGVPAIVSNAAPLEPDPYKNIVINGRVTDWSKIRSVITNVEKFSSIQAFINDGLLFFKDTINDTTEVTGEYQLLKFEGATSGGYKNAGFTHMIKAGELFAYAGMGDEWNWTKLANTAEVIPEGAYTKVDLTALDTIPTKIAMSCVLVNEPDEGTSTIVGQYPLIATQAFDVPTLKAAYMA